MSSSTAPLFASFWMAGFECSSQRRRDGVRLDLLRATRHDRFAGADYARCADRGFTSVRDGLRWHRIETAPGVFDWSSWLPMVAAADAAGVEIIWDLFHYGWPDFHDPRSDDFPRVYADYARAAAETHLAATGRPIRACPLNEISFFTWAVEVGYFPPAVADRPIGWMKRQLVAAAIAAAAAMEEVCPGRRFYWAEPLIHVAPHDRSRKQVRGARAFTDSQFEAYDMLMGLTAPELGGHPAMVDAIGLNYYPHNQWYWNGPTIPMGHHEYRPMSELLVEVWERYRKPIFIAETGAENSGRAAWLHYVCDELRIAMAAGVRIDALCLYPITDYPGWDNGRHCRVGLFGAPDAAGDRPLHEPLADEIARQQAVFADFARDERNDYAAAAAPRSRLG